MVLPLLVKASRSWPDWKFPVMATVALARVVLSTSDRVRPLSMAAGVLSVKGVVPPAVVTWGASLTAVTLTILVEALLASVPSLTVKLTVRALVLGLSAAVGVSDGAKGGLPLGQGRGGTGRAEGEHSGAAVVAGGDVAHGAAVIGEGEQVLAGTGSYP